MSRFHVYEFLSSSMGVKVWQDFVPEDEDLPAVSYYRMGSGTNKPLDDKIDLRTSTYTIEILHNANRIECDELADRLRYFDGSTDHINFQRISILSDIDMPITDPNVKVFGVTIDVEFTLRANIQ